MRRAGAAAREMLMQAAAEDWGVAVSDLTAQDSLILHVASGRSDTFGALSTRAAALTPNLKPELKDPSRFHTFGTSKPRFDLPPKVNGSAQYG